MKTYKRPKHKIFLPMTQQTTFFVSSEIPEGLARAISVFKAKLTDRRLRRWKPI